MALSTTSRLSRKSYKEQVGALFILPIFKYPLVLSLFCPYSNTHCCSLYSTHSNTHWPTAPFCGRISVRSILHSTCVSLVGGRMAISQGKPSYEGCRRFCAKKNRLASFMMMFYNTIPTILLYQKPLYPLSAFRLSVIKSPSKLLAFWQLAFVVLAVEMSSFSM